MDLPQHERLEKLIDLQKKTLFADQILLTTIKYQPPQDPEVLDENGEPVPVPESDPYSYEAIPLADQKILVGLINDEINRMKL